MFEVLDELDARRARRWEAPRIGKALPPPGTRPATADRGASDTVPPADDRPSDDRPSDDGTTDDGGMSVAAASPATAADAASTIASGEVSDATRDQETPGDAPSTPSTEASHDAREDARRQAFAAETATLLGSLARARDARDAVLEDELLALARAMARLIVRRELEHDVGMMRGVVREALARLPRLSEAPVVRLHPIDAAAVETAAADGAFDADRVTVVADRALARGDCRIESGTTLIDAGIDAWVAAIATRHGVFEPIAPVASASAASFPDETATSAPE